MSSVPPSSSTPPGMSVSGIPAAERGSREIKLVSHSPIFYWWPIWLLGYIMAFITYTEGHRLAILPSNENVKIEVTEWQGEGQEKAPAAYRVDIKGSTSSLNRAVGFEKKKDLPETPPGF